MKSFIIPLITVLAINFSLQAQEKSADSIQSGALKDSVLLNNKKPCVKMDTLKKEFSWKINKKIKKHSGKFEGHWESVIVGFNGFDNPDYSMYGGNEFMSLNQGKSIEVDVNFCDVNIGLYKSNIGLVSGIGLSFNNYRFEEPYTILKGSLITEPVSLAPENLSKTKLAVSYLQMPLLLEFQVPVNQNNGRVYINAGVLGGIRIGSHTKVKYGSVKDKDRSGFNMNSFKYAATASVGYNKVGLFGSYNLTPLFKSGKGPELTPFTIGISLKME